MGPIGHEVDQKWTGSGPEVNRKWTRSGSTSLHPEILYKRLQILKILCAVSVKKIKSVE